MNREPVTLSAAVVMFFSSMVNFLQLIDVIDFDREQLAALNLVVTNAAVLAGAFVARAWVTPKNDPQTDSGQPMEVLPQYLNE